MILNKSNIVRLLNENDRAVERALVALLARQTNDEVSVEDTKHKNWRGFNAADAKFMTSCAKVVQRGYPLSEKQLWVLRNRYRVQKYWRQLISVAKEKKVAG